jgi:hypothetical protein
MGEANRRLTVIEGRKTFKEVASGYESDVKRYYVYEYRFYPDPHKNQYCPVYVGKGTGYRVADHLHKLVAGIHSNSLLQRIYNKSKGSVLSLQPFNGGEWRIALMENMGRKEAIKESGNYFLEYEAFEIEMDLIKEHGRRDNGTGVLANLTDGGPGTEGRVLSEEELERLSKDSFERWLDPEFRIKMRAAFLQRESWSDESRSLLSNSLHRYWDTHPEMKEHMSRVQKRRFQDPEERRKLGIAIKAGMAAAKARRAAQAAQ